jgi:hypothetical protein
MTKKSLSDFLNEEVFLDAPKNTSDTAKKSHQDLASSQSTTN